MYYILFSEETMNLNGRQIFQKSGPAFLQNFTCPSFQISCATVVTFKIPTYNKIITANSVTANVAKREIIRKTFFGFVFWVFSLLLKKTPQIHNTCSTKQPQVLYTNYKDIDKNIKKDYRSIIACFQIYVIITNTSFHKNQML